ncbi:hypothetical protein AMJ80_09000 [bacterium SM23_31]|nr:MAG: hypothetical protein AMJ80_09000 [bacterium SM23_31]
MKKKKSDYSTAKICSMFDVTKTTLFKWEKEGKLTKVKKDWRGWRVFTDKNIEEIRKIIQEKKRQNM